MGNQTVRGSLVSDNLSDIWLSAHFGSGLKGNQWGTKQFRAYYFWNEPRGRAVLKLQGAHSQVGITRRDHAIEMTKIRSGTRRGK